MALILRFKKDGFENLTALPAFRISWVGSTVFQPIGGVEGVSSPWLFFYSSPTGLMFDSRYNTWTFDHTFHRISITEPYGSVPDDLPYLTPAITAGVISGVLALVLIILGLLFYFLRRHYGRGFMSAAWTRWKRKIMTKILEILSKDEENLEEAKKGTFDKRNTERSQDQESEYDKIEDGSKQSFELQGIGKILVTPDMELSGLVEITPKQEAGSDQIRFHEHPRPTIVTSLSRTAVQYKIADEEEAEAHSKSSSTLTLLPRAAPSAPPHPPSPSLVLQPYHSIPMSHALLPPIVDDRAEIAGGEAIKEPSSAVSLTTKVAEPPDTTVVDLKALGTPLSFPEPIAPSAPPLDRTGTGRGSIEPDAGGISS